MAIVGKMSALYLTIVAAIGLVDVAESAPAEAQVSNSPQYSCGRDTSNWYHPKDFRLRNTTKLKGRYLDGKRNHLDPANSSMDDGIYKNRVLTHIDFLLRRWPNHYLALQALIRYEAGGGRTDPTNPGSCYFDLARRFAPDDANVLILQGMYYHRKEDRAMAEAAWQRALQIDPDSAEAHYNLGLLYVASGRLDDALKHAIAAYDSGYPLPGLKNKLAEAGQWAEQAD